MENRQDELIRIRHAFGLEFYRQLLEALPGGLVYVSKEGAVLEANEEAVDFLGLAYDRLTQRWVSDWEPSTVYEDGRPCPAEAYPVTRCLLTGRPQPPLTLGVRRPDGQLRWATFTAVPVGAGESPEPLGAIVTFIDVSERKRTEKALRTSRKELHALLDHSPDHVLTTDREGTILFVNRPVPRLPQEDVLGRRVYDFVAPEQAALYEEAFRTVFELGQPTSLESRVEENGRTYVTRLVPIRGGDGEVERALLIATDVTEQRRAEARNHQAQRLESLGVLAGGIAHDFNNLLVGILGNLELALLDLGQEHAARPLLEDAQTTARRAAEMTRQLLTYSGRGRLRRVATDLNELLREAPHLLGERLSRQAELRLELAPALPPTLVDRVQLRQVILNLLTNASDALGRDPGTITLRTARVDAAELPPTPLVGEPAHPSYLLLEVQDDGEGMSPKVSQRLFEPFFSTRGIRGQGLGMAPVLGMVRAHGGVLALETAPGQGTRVQLFLPLLPCEVDPNASDESRVEPLGRGASVLVIDDEPHVRQVARRALETYGYQVDLAEDGASGLELYRERRADLVLLDQSMPGLPGEQVLRRLLELDPQARVLLSSGCFTEKTLDPLQGAVGFLSKPYTLDELLGAVARALRGTRSS